MCICDFTLVKNFHSLKAASDASSLGLNTHIVRDAGRTQIAPGSKTVLCVGPGRYCVLPRVQ